MKITTLFFGLLFAGIATAQTATPATDSMPARPLTTIAIDSSFYDFGSVKQGTLVKRTFRFTNTGADSLLIADVKVTCGCTVPDWPKQPVPPGGKGEIKVEFNTANKEGRQLRILRVVANTNPAETMLQMGGDIRVAKKKKPKAKN
jgi:hypothetical protein